jgi:FkbM family methyltransferase
VTSPSLPQRIARSRRAQAFLRRPRVDRIASVLIQASTVHSSFRFAWRELTGGVQPAAYRLRRSGRLVFIRHNTADPVVLAEIFHFGHYVLPDHVAAFLDGLGRPVRVLDLGANIGLFGVWALERFPGADIVAFEPDPENAAVARRAVEAAAARWRLVEAAASNVDGRTTFLTGEYSRSRIDPGATGIEVEMQDAFPAFEGIDLAKIDIEGGEWALMQDPRFRELSVPVLVLEYHHDQAPDDDPRAAALAAVRGAGYEAEVVEEFTARQGVLWAWKPEIARS